MVLRGSLIKKLCACAMVCCVFLFEKLSHNPLSSLLVPPLPYISASYHIAFRNQEHTFRFTMIPDLDRCRRKDVIVATVITVAKNLDMRQAIRQSWANANLVDVVKSGELVTYFIISGGRNNKTVQKELEAEQKMYQDLIMTDLPETYENLVLKVYSSLVFKSVHCPEAQYHIKIDDDVVFHPDRFMHYLKASIITDNAIIGGIWSNSKPHREKKHRWYVSHAMWPYKYYPKYCNGPFYVMKKGATDLLLREVPKFYRFDMEDIFFTGIVADRARVPRLNWNRHFLSNQPEKRGPVGPCNSDGIPFLFAVHSAKTPELLIEGIEELKYMNCTR